MREEEEEEEEEEHGHKPQNPQFSKQHDRYETKLFPMHEKYTTTILT
jgi:hypothetical protein